MSCVWSNIIPRAAHINKLESERQRERKRKSITLWAARVQTFGSAQHTIAPGINVRIGNNDENKMHTSFSALLKQKAHNNKDRLRCSNPSLAHRRKRLHNIIKARFLEHRSRAIATSLCTQLIAQLVNVAFLKPLMLPNLLPGTANLDLIRLFRCSR